MKRRNADNYCKTVLAVLRGSSYDDRRLRSVQPSLSVLITTNGCMRILVKMNLLYLHDVMIQCRTPVRNSDCAVRLISALSSLNSKLLSWGVGNQSSRLPHELEERPTFKSHFIRLMAPLYSQLLICHNPYIRHNTLLLISAPLH